MTAAASVKNETNTNPFQKFLIPVESKWVCYAMRKAGEYGSSGNFIYAHVLSVAIAVSAVALSALNAFLYLIQTPFKCLLNIVRFSPLDLVKNLLIDVASIVQSVVFVSLGVPFVVAGAIFPHAIFSYFAPEYYDTLESSYERLRIENGELKGKLGVSEERVETQAIVIRDLQNKLDSGRWLC